MRHILAAAAIAATASLAAVAAHATSYDVFTDYGANVFSYGSGVGADLIPFSTNYSSCFSTNLECVSSTGSSSVPAVGRVSTGASASFATVVVPTGVLFLHPDNGATPPTSVVFTAPSTGSYSISGFFERLDTSNGSGNGVNYNVYDNATSVLSGNLPNTTYGETSAISDTLFLTAGDKLSFSVSNVGGDYSYDSTGLSATIASVPEPATWTLMFIGFGFVGGMARSRRRTAVAA